MGRRRPACGNLRRSQTRHLLLVTFTLLVTSPPSPFRGGGVGEERCFLSLIMFIQRFICNFIEENCYVLWDDTREAVLVDCGAQTAQEQTAVIEFIKDNKLTPVSHLLTHGHFDHIFGAQALYDVFGLSPRVHTADVSTYYGAAEQMLLFLHRRIDHPDIGASGPRIGKGQTAPLHPEKIAEGHNGSPR